MHDSVADEPNAAQDVEHRTRSIRTAFGYNRAAGPAEAPHRTTYPYRAAFSHTVISRSRDARRATIQPRRRRRG
jgi:hypothetical protein